MSDVVTQCYLCKKPAARACSICKRAVCEYENCLPDPTLDECEACTCREMLAMVAHRRHAPERYASAANIDVAKLRRFFAWETWEDLYLLDNEEVDRLLRLAANKE